MTVRSFLDWPDDPTPRESDIATIAISEAPIAGGISLAEVEAERERRKTGKMLALAAQADRRQAEHYGYCRGFGHGASVVAVGIFLGGALAFALGIAH